MVFSIKAVAGRSSYLATFSEGNLTYAGECALTVAFRTKMVPEAWVARMREGSRWRLKNFILAAELVERRGTIEINKRRARGGELGALYTIWPGAFAYLWCVAPLRRNHTTNPSNLVMTLTLNFLTHLARSCSVSTQISPQRESDGTVH